MNDSATLRQARGARVKVGGDKDLFRLRSLSGREQLSRPFCYELLVETIPIRETDLADLSRLLGKNLHVEIDTGHDVVRHLDGHVADVTFAGRQIDKIIYKLTMAPWLWFFGFNNECRIFQNKSVLDIVNEVFHPPRVSDQIFEPINNANYSSLKDGSYKKRDYCVQYHESDLNFVSRLLEDEGIYYYFNHDDSSHTLILVDHPGLHQAIKGYAEITYCAVDEEIEIDRQCFRSWEILSRVRPGQVTMGSFDFQAPRANLTAQIPEGRDVSKEGRGVYDRSRPYTRPDHGEALAQIRLEELQSNQSRAFATGNTVGLACGACFKLANAPRQADNVDYIVVATDTFVNAEGSRPSIGSLDEFYRCELELQDARLPFRPERRTPKPFVRGPQTAVVSGGPNGEDIWTDEHGRVKVKFHWDCADTPSATSSCWIRVSQAWAGAGFGAIHIPRAGQEVIVDFLEGDPDQPIITGRVYNGDAKPPHPLPREAAKSGIKSQTVKGNGSNELTFDDTKENQKTYFHAQRDHEAVIENDEKQHVKSNRVRNVDGNEEVKVTKDRSRQVGGKETVKVLGAQEISVDGKQKVVVTADATLTTNANREVTAIASYKLQAMTIEINAQASITLSVGASSVKIDPSGVSVVAPLVKLN